MYIFLIVNIRSNLTHRGGFHFFRFYQQNKSSASKVKLQQANNRDKKVLEAVTLAYANKTKKSSLCKNLAVVTFWKLLIVFSTKAWCEPPPSYV